MSEQNWNERCANCGHPRIQHFNGRECCNDACALNDKRIGCLAYVVPIPEDALAEPTRQSSRSGS